MKKIIALLVVIFVLFAVYLLKTDTELTQKLLKPVVVYQCGIELEATRLWKVSTALLGEEKKNQLQTKICGIAATWSISIRLSANQIWPVSAEKEISSRRS